MGKFYVADDEVLYTVLANWMIVRMTLTKNIPLYIKIGKGHAMVKYESQKPTCRLKTKQRTHQCPKTRSNND
jgi:hypothetical protein